MSYICIYILIQVTVISKCTFVQQKELALTGEDGSHFTSSSQASTVSCINVAVIVCRRFEVFH